MVFIFKSTPALILLGINNANWWLNLFPSSPMWSITVDTPTMVMTNISLTHWGRDKMGANFLTTFSNALFLIKYISISTETAPKFVPKGPINNIPALVQIMTWRRHATTHYLNQWWPSLLMYICITRPQWVNPCHAEFLLSKNKLMS